MGGITVSDFKTYYMYVYVCVCIYVCVCVYIYIVYSDHNSMVLTEWQILIHRWVKQSREYRNRATQTQPTDLWQRCKSNSVEEDGFSNKWCRSKWTSISPHKMNLDQSLTPFIKIKWKWIIDLNGNYKKKTFGPRARWVLRHNT